MSFILNINDSALKRIKEVLTNKSSDIIFKIEITPGGCSGFNTSFKLDNIITENDLIIEKDDVKVVIHKLAADLIQEAELTYNTSILNSYFALNVKTAKDKCSCGSSFSL
jgi:iron-sulfur cluster insertion protein